MARHVPLRQVARRLELTARRRLAPHLSRLPDRRPPPPVASSLPQPLFPPRRLLEPAAGGWRFWQPWGSMELPERINWRLPGSDTDALTASWQVNLHYMELLEGVDDDAFVAIVNSWIAENPLSAPDSWSCAWWSYNLSIRVVVWMQQIARRLPRLPPSFLANATMSLGQQLRFLERHLETDLRGNHLIRNLKALIWAGTFFTGPEAERWRRTGEALLARELAWQVLGDGCHYELSPSYHCQVMGDLLEVASVLEAGTFRDELLATLDRMARVSVLLTHPDGQVALFNDGGLGMAYPAATVLETHAAMGRLPPDTAGGAFALPDAGFYGLRSGDEHLIVDCGPIGPDELIGHGHGDILTFEWSVGGRRIIVDQGTYQYTAGPRRVQSRSTAGHNTVSIGDADMCAFFGAHRCGRRARPTVLEHRGDAAGFVLEGTHDGFDRLPGRPRHMRRFAALPGRIEITERIEGGGQLPGTAGLLLHPDCRVEPGGDGVTVTNGPVVVRITSTAPMTVESAEWFPDLYTTLPTCRLRLDLGVPPSSHAVRLSVSG
jgi:hypothetical protein